MRNLWLLSLKSFVLGMVLLSRSIASDARPNFLFIYTDDQRHDALGCVQKELIQSGKQSSARFPWIESPNLDRLASQGIRFRNAFVVTALCGKER
ncbi:MAG: hypothetical protein ACKO3V_15935, partial [Pirellula sp.]